MNRKKDYVRFVLLMQTIAETCPGEKPSTDKCELYFKLLQDMDYETIEKRMSDHLRFNKFFPTISEIRQEPDLEVIANRDYAIIEELIKNFLFPEFMQCGVGLIEDKLTKKEKAHLIPIFRNWGSEIMNNRNPTATRAQFIKAHIAEMKIERIRQIESGDKEQIEKTNELIEGIGK